MKTDLSNDWKCHTPQLLKEICSNSECAILGRPLEIFAGILAQVAERAAELHDVQLDALMMRLTLYEIADPYTEAYQPEVVADYMARAKEERSKQ